MSSTKKDLYFYFNNFDAYEYDITLLCINRRRGFMRMPCSELIAVAFSKYDESYPDDALFLDAQYNSCRHFVENYNISFKEDIIYLLNHPEFVKEPEKNPVVTYKKIRFNVADALQQKAYEWLNGFKPRERIDEAIKVVRQYLIKNGDEYYIEQMTLQKMRNLRRMNGPSGSLSDETKHYIDVIWNIGGYAGRDKK